ncbi:hypothetical protein ACW0JY_24325, partial [Pseudomonas aeruginosa]
MRIVCLLVLLSLIGGCSHSVTLQERAEQEAIFIQEFRQEFAKGNSEKDFLIWQNTATPPTEFPDEAD